MKRMIAFFLLIATLFASGHATWVFHYCSGSLRSVGLAGYADAHACCCRKAQAGDAENRILVGNTPCCANRFISPVTDDCTAVRYEARLEMSHDFQPALPGGYGLFGSCENTASLLHQKTFPPGGLARSGAALRLLICICRI
ncbi:MAG: hypothetical protein LBF85_07600 [Tannerella sp.]|jgi:hypothetical protein|nr:hypothetical protein [Tannerella sp.]